MVEVKHITKSFEGRVVLNDISAVFETGKTNLIIGRSGSGKTVLIKNIIGLMRPDSGEILYDGRDLTSMDKHELNMLRREMGMLFQGSALFDSMTVLENVMFPLDMFSNDTYKDRLKRAKFCLDRVNLSEAGHLYPSEISGGMMKRADIAQPYNLSPRQPVYHFILQRLQHRHHIRRVHRTGLFHPGRDLVQTHIATRLCLGIILGGIILLLHVLARHYRIRNFFTHNRTFFLELNICFSITFQRYDNLDAPMTRKERR